MARAKKTVAPSQAKQDSPQNQSLEQKAALKYVKEAYQDGKLSSSLDFTRFAGFYHLFRNRQVKKNYQGLSNLFVPEPYRVVRKKTAKLAGAIRGVIVKPTKEGQKDAATIGSHLLNYIREKLSWQIYERTAIQESRIVGIAWLRLVWDLDKQEEDKPWKGFDLDFLSADQIFVSPGTTALDLFNGNYRYLIHEYEADIGKLRLNKNYNQAALDLLEKQGGVRVQKSSLQQSRDINIRSNQGTAIPGKIAKRTKVIDFWGKYKGATDKEDREIIMTIANDDIVLRFDDNPYQEVLDFPIPFVPVIANLVGKELYPIGDIEPSESLFNELNDTRNQRMDTVTLNIDPPKEVVKSAGIQERELVARRGWIIHSNIPNGIRFIPPDMQGVRAAIDEEKIIRGDIEQTTGVVDFSPGSEVQAGVSIDTARGVIVAKGEADVITNDDVDLLKVSLRMLYRLALAYAQEFLDQQFVMRVMERGVESFYKVSKEDIQGNLDLDIEMKTLQDKTTDQQLKLMLLNQAKTIPGAKIGKFFEDVLEAFNDSINIQDYYQEPSPTSQGPKVSISLKGDLNPVEVDEIYKSMGLDPAAADPLLRQDLRQMMRGNLPEHQQPTPTGVPQPSPQPSPTGTANPIIPTP